MEKTVNIRFANFSQLMRTGGNGDINALFNSHLMALLGGYLSNALSDAEVSKKRQAELIDKSEEAMMTKGTSAPPYY